uniref:Cysteine-rich PDZ-binding protein n=1 Tax=Cyprinus carpio TaxID=7962 RepID=A0A8C1Y3K9_CYPCA
MVCEKCEKKLGRVITPDTWKDGARNTTESGGRKLNENKMLTSKKARFDPYGKSGFNICRICKSSVHQSGSHYCQGCAYKKGELDSKVMLRCSLVSVTHLYVLTTPLFLLLQEFVPCVERRLLTPRTTNRPRFDLLLDYRDLSLSEKWMFVDICVDSSTC